MYVFSHMQNVICAGDVITGTMRLSPRRCAMIAVKLEPDPVTELIADYCAGNHAGGWPVSLSEGVATVRRWQPNLAMTDQEIRTRVAKFAVGRGLNVHFDQPV
jgi:hypothetical protein